MSRVYELLSSVLADGVICDEDVARLREAVDADGVRNIEDVKLLTQVYCDARQRTPAFDELFFSVLEQVFLADGAIDAAEQYYLLKMLYADRAIRPREKEFLRRIRQATPRDPQFEALFATASAAPEVGWEVGGR